ncbi:MAG: polysaccharide biosynthesis C-terminal domain-containing protein, partial [Muribaculaceae bacterium]|nr:polysaccharide biosynthesis C-terminal domain-containing protein [Muribaculaceae bacterium]
FYRPDFGIGYIFLSILIAWAVNLLMMIPELTGFRWSFSGKLLGEMLRYSAPLLVLGVAGIMNQTVDKLLYPYLVSDPAEAMEGLGIYGANYKVAIVMVMFIQAFRFAYEPFIFSQAKEKGAKSNQAYCDAMKFFVIFAVVLFLGVMFYLPVLRYFISPRYFSGLAVVPIIMLAEFFFGVFFNLSVWYKLSDRTVWGMYFSLIGVAVTVTLNIVLVPRFGYMGCAWAALASYFVMMTASYFTGKLLHPIGYPVKRLLGYMAAGAICYVAGIYAVDTPWMWLNYIIRGLIITAFLALCIRKEHIPLPGLRK